MNFIFYTHDIFPLLAYQKILVEKEFSHFYHPASGDYQYYEKIIGSLQKLNWFNIVENIYKLYQTYMIILKEIMIF